MPLQDNGKKARALKRKISWYATWITLSVMIISVVSSFILSLPVWRINSVKVSGNDYIPEAKIFGIAKIPQGENIFMLDLDDVRQRFSNVIQIKDIKIKRKLPDTIMIEVRERKPFAIAVIGGTTSLIDEGGYVIAQKSLGNSIYKMDVAKYPVVRGIGKNSLENGVRLNIKDREFIRSSLEMLSKFMGTGTIQMDISDRDDMIIYIEDLIKVRIGDAGEIEKKLNTVKAMISSLKDKWTKVSYIDVRIPDGPVIKFR